MKIAGNANAVQNAAQFGVKDERKQDPKTASLAQNLKVSTPSEVDSKSLAKSAQASRSSAKSSPSPADELGAFAKNANATIGALDVMIRSLQSLQTQNKHFAKLALKLQDSTQAQSPDLSQKADKIKAKMQEIFDSSTFDDENVFVKDYQEVLPENKLNPKKLSPSKLSLKQPENLSQYAKDLSEQKHYAKQAKKLLKANLQERADAVQKTDSSYEKLDRARLTEPEFKAAQGSSGVTLDRILHLLR